jgi:hypothetical protein
MPSCVFSLFIKFARANHSTSYITIIYYFQASHARLAGNKQVTLN